MARKILRYPLDERTYDGGEVATIKVGDNPVLRRVGPGTSPRICAWVEVDVDDAGEATTANEMRFAFVGTGDLVPDGEYVTTTGEAGPTGTALRHIFRLS